MFTLNKTGRCMQIIASTLQVQKAGVSHAHVPPYTHPNPLVQPKATKRKFQSKHYNKDFKRERGLKTIKVKLPDFREKDVAAMNQSEIRAKMKELGLQPHRPWTEKPMYFACTGSCFEPYVPPEGDGKAALISKKGAKQKMDVVTHKGKTMMTIRKIRQFDEDFERRDFTGEAQKIYLDLHKHLADFNEDELHKLVTEKAYSVVVDEVKYKTIRWSFLGSLEPPRIVHARQTHLITEDNVFAQVTVRFHTTQTLAVYDRFGRLIYGSEVVARDCLEYVVFEKNISNTYGLWRVHHKIVPEWMEMKTAGQCTFRLQKEESTSEVAEPESSPPPDSTPPNQQEEPPLKLAAA